LCIGSNDAYNRASTIIRLTDIVSAENNKLT